MNFQDSMDRANRLQETFQIFYDCGGWLEVVLATDQELEDGHNWIQLTFPNRKPSQFNPGAHLLTDADVEFAKRETQQAKIRAVYSRILLFFFNRITGYWWIKKHDHNHLRMTRIIYFLKECYPDLAKDFFIKIGEVAEKEPGYLQNSYEHWDEAYYGSSIENDQY